MSGGANRAAGLDAIRFSAALMVAIGHFGDRVGAPPVFELWAADGVSIFFVLSGYLLWRPFVDGQADLRRYALSRVARILPAYWLACVVLVALRGGSLPAALLMAQDHPIAVVWTLRAEVMFYAALPFLGLLRRPLLVPVALGIGSLLLDHLGGVGPSTESLLPFRFWAFAPGMILAVLQPRPNRAWLVAGIAGLIVGALFPVGLRTSPISALGAFFLVGWGVTAHPRGQWTLLAGMSYALYLWHVDLIEILGPVGLAASFAVALVSYVALEAPVMGLLRHRRPERDDEKRDGRWRWRGRVIGHDNVDVRA